jgi:outer membrane beta-barrel protein
MKLIKIKLLVMMASLMLSFTVNAEEVIESVLKGTPLIEPVVEREEIIDAKIDDEDFEIGFYGGFYSTEDFGTNSVIGARFAYHITEDFFIEFTGGESTTRETSAETLFFVELLDDDERILRYYNVSIGYNVLPGEAFISSGWAFYTAFYAVAGVGTTQFAGENLFTVNAGVGFRFIVTDWLAVHFDMRDHIYELDVITDDELTHNLELHSGITFFF